MPSQMRPGMSPESDIGQRRMIMWVFSEKHRYLKNVRKMAQEFSDDYTRVSGWLHNYVCPDCSSSLSFDRNSSQYRDNRFVCPVCGRTVSGKAYQEAWVYQYRIWYAEHLIEAAYCRESEEAVNYLIRYVDYYADHYADMPEHGEKVGKGKIMAQSLDEAVFGIHVLRAVFYCRNSVPEEKLITWADKLFLPMAEFLLPQAERIHNISVWIWCYIGMAGLVFGKEQLADKAVNGPYGLLQQFSRGLTEDMLWQEGSLHYHYYALEALTYFCEISSQIRPSGVLQLIMKEMYKAPMRLSFDGYHLPSINDGWYPLTLESYAPQILCAAYITGDEEIKAQAEQIVSRNSKAASEPETAILTDHPYVNRQILNNHLGVLNGAFNIILKSGSLVSTHAHKDNLSIIIEGISDDLGTPGYGSPIIKSWYRNSLSHNTLSVDGTQNWLNTANDVREADGGLEARAEGKSGGEPVKAVRRLKRKNDSVTDHFEVETGKPHVFDWTFHCVWPLTFSGEEMTVDDLYPEFENTKRIRFKDKPEIRFENERGECFNLKIRESDGMEIYTALTPGNPGVRKRNTLVLRMKGRKAVFEVLYEKPAGKNHEKKNNTGLFHHG